MKLLAVILLLLAGCAANPGTPPQSGTICTTVKFTDWNSIDRECRALGTQARTSIYGCATLEPPHFVIAPQPHSMGDERALCVLGHEIAHNLGGTH